jgi:hypothetical protein
MKLKECSNCITHVTEIGKDIKRIKDMGVEHIIFAFVGLELDKVIDTAKQLGKFAR